MSLFTASGALLLLLAIGTLSPLADAAKCSSQYANRLKVTCVAADGTTEFQNPKGNYGLPNYAPPGTDCNDIPVPSDDALPAWLYCLRTVQFNFEWTYDGLNPTELVSLRRSITNDLGIYPYDVTNTVVEEYWGHTITAGTTITNTYHQVVVDLCKEPITYTYDLSVTVADSSSTGQCTDAASYAYDIQKAEPRPSLTEGFGSSKRGVAIPSFGVQQPGATATTGSSILITALANSRTVSWMHNGGLSPPNGIKELSNIEFVPSITKWQDITDIRNGAASLALAAVPRDGPGLLAFCGDEEEISASEAADVYPTLVGNMERPNGSTESPNIIVCADSCDWIDSFAYICRANQNLATSDRQKDDDACGFRGIGINSYACNTNDLRMDIERFNSCLNPGQQIWINEITCREDSAVTRDPTRMAQYIKDASKYLDKHPNVARYSFGSSDAFSDNKAADGTYLLDSAALFNGSGGVTPMGGVVLGLPEESSTNPFYSCDNEWGSEFIKKNADVTKTFMIEAQEVTLTKTKKKRRTCEWLSRLSQSSIPGKQLKLNKFCSNEKKARDVCPGVCVGRCRYTEPLVN